jgi:hypothetical protein
MFKPGGPRRPGGSVGQGRLFVAAEGPRQSQGRNELRQEGHRPGGGPGASWCPQPVTCHLSAVTCYPRKVNQINLLPFTFRVTPIGNRGPYRGTLFEPSRGTREIPRLFQQRFRVPLAPVRGIEEIPAVHVNCARQSGNRVGHRMDDIMPEGCDILLAERLGTGHFYLARTARDSAPEKCCLRCRYTCSGASCETDGPSRSCLKKTSPRVRGRPTRNRCVHTT